MWMRVLRLIYSTLAEGVAAKEALERTRLLLALVENLECLQSQPGEFAEPALRALDDVGLGASEPTFLLALDARVRGSESFEAVDWLVISCLGELAELLEFGWKPFYEPIAAEYPALASKLNALRGSLQAISFAHALEKLAREWQVGKDRDFDHVAIALIRVCAMIGTLDATGELYRHVASLLSFEREFFTVWTAGACLKLQVISGSMDLSELTDEQYGCMRMLDQFSSLPGIPWG